MSAEPKPVANPYARPKHHGVSFAEPLHSKPEGVTEPSKTKLPSNFVVAIFGSSQGIGAGIAAAYAKAGAYGFLLCARNETSLYRTAKSILAVKPDAKIVCQSCDVTKSEDVREIASATKIAFGRLDACIVNAGISQSLITNPEDGSTHSPRGFFEGEADAFRGVMDTNTLGLFHAARYMVPLLRESEDGAQAFVGISSAVAHMSESNCNFLPPIIHPDLKAGRKLTPEQMCQSLTHFRSSRLHGSLSRFTRRTTILETACVRSRCTQAAY